MTTHEMSATGPQRSSRWILIVLGGLILAAVLFRGTPSLFAGGQIDVLVFVVALPIEGLWMLALGVLMWRRGRG